MIYLSATKRLIQFDGFRKIGLPHLGQRPENNYELHHETFQVRSMIRVADGRYAFEAISDGPFGRTVTGKIRYGYAESRRNLVIAEFQMDEHGQTIEGVMNRYSLSELDRSVGDASKVRRGVPRWKFRSNRSRTIRSLPNIRSRLSLALVAFNTGPFQFLRTSRRERGVGAYRLARCATRVQRIPGNATPSDLDQPLNETADPVLPRSAAIGFNPSQLEGLVRARFHSSLTKQAGSPLRVSPVPISASARWAREAAKHAFSQFLSGGTTANQVEFVNLVVDYLTENGVMDPKRLYESPFTDPHPRGPEGVFSSAQVDQLVAVLTEIRERAAA